MDIKISEADVLRVSLADIAVDKAVLAKQACLLRIERDYGFRFDDYDLFQDGTLKKKRASNEG